jgi:hypothetical protein
MAAYLSQNRLGVLSAAEPVGLSMMPVRYRNQGVEVECLLPCWADLIYYLEQDSRVALVITIGYQDNGLCWLHYLGTARLVSSPNWTALVTEEIPLALANALYRVIHLSPQRIDLIEVRQGRARRETLEILTSQPTDDSHNLLG